MITLQFSAQNDIASWAIRRFTWSQYSHVDLVLPDGSLLGARTAAGVSIAPAHPCHRAARFTVDAPDEVLAIAKGQIGKPYDWSGIFGMISRSDWQQPDQWFCSELVAWAFQQAGMPLINAQTHRITPRDLLLSPYLQPAPM